MKPTTLFSLLWLLACLGLCAACRSTKHVVQRVETVSSADQLRHVEGTTVVTTLQLQGYIDSTENNARFRPSPYIPATLTTTTTQVTLADTSRCILADYQLNDTKKVVNKGNAPVNDYVKVIVLVLGLLTVVFLVGLAARRC